MSMTPGLPASMDWGVLPHFSQPVRVALIGISGYGFMHLQLARELADRGLVTLVAAVVINPAQEAANVRDLEGRGCEIHADYEKMLRRHAGQIDLCLIPTGIPWHKAMTIAALRAGANVLVEKPLAGTPADVDAIQEAEAKSGRFVAVGFQDFYTAGTRWLKQQLLDGAIGQVKTVRALGFWPRAAEYYERNSWAGRLYAQGAAVFDSPFNNAFGHFANLALFFSGQSARDVARAEDVEADLFRAHAIESFDTGVVRGRTAGGTTLWLGFSHACNRIADPLIMIEGSAGQAIWSYEQSCCVNPAGGAPRSHVLPDAMNTRRQMFAGVLHRLADPASPICDTEMAARHTGLVASIHASGPIRAFPPGLVEWHTLPKGKSPIPAVRGIEVAMQQAFEQQRLLRELGFPLVGVPVG